MTTLTIIKEDKFVAVDGEGLFLDAVVLRQHIPHLEIIKDAGHSPTPLLKQLAKRILN